MAPRSLACCADKWRTQRPYKAAPARPGLEEARTKQTEESPSFTLGQAESAANVSLTTLSAVASSGSCKPSAQLNLGLCPFSRVQIESPYIGAVDSTSRLSFSMTS